MSIWRAIRISAACLLIIPTSAIAAHLRGRCVSQNTGTQIGIVYGESNSELLFECGKIATNPIVTNVVQLPCAIDDVYPGCESGTPSPITCSGESPPADAIASPSIVTAPQGASGRSCVSLPKSIVASKAYCRLYDYPNTHWCAYRTDTGGCPYVASRRFTVADRGTALVYCWTFYNQADRGRDFQLYVK